MAIMKVRDLLKSLSFSNMDDEVEMDLATDPTKEDIVPVDIVTIAMKDGSLVFRSKEVMYERKGKLQKRSRG